MKKYCFFFILTLTPFLSKSQNNLATVNDFGKEFFRQVKTGKSKNLSRLKLKQSEVSYLIDNSSMDTETKNNLKKAFLEKFSEIELNENIELGLKRLNSDVAKMGCKLKKTALIKVVDNISSTKKLPFEIGEISIIYSCNEKRGEISIEVMKTQNGWKIMDDIVTSILKSD